VPLTDHRLLLVVITDTGRVEQRAVDLPGPAGEDSVVHLRAVLNACLDGRRLTEVASVVADLPERVEARERSNAAAVFSVILETLAERHEERVVVGGAANLASADFSKGLHEVLEALEEQVVLMRLLGESADQALVTVRIGAENQVEGLQSASMVATGYGSGDQALARLGVLGPTRMDYPTAMGAVRAVARYVGQILAGA
jgi:heat-inducible transcriptional repressor